MIDPSLLCSVRDEIRTHLSFTRKETDIYRLHQSGDLANLSGLDPASLARLPSLLTLRDALYSPDFRLWISQVADSGPLSGQKTDMAINIYTPGDHLMCHDDVIGTRRLSYILYVTDPDTPWRPEWGGALRLYPLEKRHRPWKSKNDNSKEEEVKIPSPEWSQSIPPEFNQLSFFAVQPGESFHDVEEVYHRMEDTEGKDDSDDGGRVRMAISGWYHIPQRGEEGYEDGLEKRLAEKSSLAQLQGNVDEFDEPQPRWVEYLDAKVGQQLSGSDEELSEAELDYLLQFMNPKYLTPDVVEQLEDMFADDSSLRLADFLSSSYVRDLYAYIVGVESRPRNSLQKVSSILDWRLARPPHKHRFQYCKSEPANDGSSKELSPILDILNGFFASRQFRKWLSLATGLKLSRSNLTARRFRRGLDYTLATAYENDEPQLEFTFGMTPTGGWEETGYNDEAGRDEDQNGEVDEDDSSEDEIPSEPANVRAKESGADGRSASKYPKSNTNQQSITKASEHIDVGGHEVYMAAEDTSSTADPAQYNSSGQMGDEEDDSILFSAPPAFNHLSVVLRDKGVLRFVKFVSQKAQGDRWDIVGEFEVEDYDAEGNEVVEEMGESIGGN